MRLFRIFSDPSGESAARAYDSRPQLPITKSAARLNDDRSYVRISDSKTETLSASEIVRASQLARRELLERYGRYLNILAGSKTGSTDGARPQPFSASKNEWSMSVTPSEIRIEDRNGRAFTLGGEGKPMLRGRFDEGAEGFLLTAFENLLVKGEAQGQPLASNCDPAVAQLYLHLFGPAGLIQKNPLPAQERFLTPKLIAWDLNGTAEHRPGIAEATHAMNLMGAASVITTTMSGETGESSMRGHDAPFTGFHGGREIRPRRNKVYGEMAAAYGLEPKQLKHQLAVVGDQETDAPSDVDDVLFVLNGNRTPAAALQILFHELDQRGRGSFYDGVQSLLAGRRAAEVTLGPLSFKLEIHRPGKNQIPVISRLEVRFSAKDLADALADPSAASLSGAAKHTLAATQLRIISDRAFANMARDLMGSGARSMIAREIERRVSARQSDVESAQKKSAELLRDARKLTASEFLSAASGAAAVGDPKTQQTLTAASSVFAAAYAARRPDKQKATEAFAGELERRLNALLAAAEDGAVLFPEARGFSFNSPSRRVVELADGLPSSERDREKLLSLLDEALSLTARGAKSAEKVEASVVEDALSALPSNLVKLASADANVEREIASIASRGETAIVEQNAIWAAIGEAYAR